MIEVRSTRIPGCFELQPRIVGDQRGHFVKVFNHSAFVTNGLETAFAEEYYSVSHRGVIRGLHFQIPPKDHVKMVYCVAGQVLDVVVDLRRRSPTYGQFDLMELSAMKANCIYIPKGLAHGFCVISETATLIYKVSTVYAPEHDTGIHWNSVAIPWPLSNPILSARDCTFPALAEFDSPFSYD